MSTSIGQNVRIERQGTTAILTMSAPERRNALSTAMMAELDAAFAAVGADTDVRVAILAGDGAAFFGGPRFARTARARGRSL